MAFFILNPNIHLVKGAVNSAIYNLNTGQILSITSAVADLIDTVGSQNIDNLNLPKEALGALEHLRGISVADFSETPADEIIITKPEKTLDSATAQNEQLGGE